MEREGGGGFAHTENQAMLTGGMVLGVEWFRCPNIKVSGIKYRFYFCLPNLLKLRVKGIVTKQKVLSDKTLQSNSKSQSPDKNNCCFFKRRIEERNLV